MRRQRASAVVPVAEIGRVCPLTLAAGATIPGMVPLLSAAVPASMVAVSSLPFDIRQPYGRAFAA
jgi:hypothetical protein